MDLRVVAPDYYEMQSAPEIGLDRTEPGERAPLGLCHGAVRNAAVTLCGLPVAHMVEFSNLDWPPPNAVPACEACELEATRR